jgi:hypothetical protein
MGRPSITIRPRSLRISFEMVNNIAAVNLG